MKTKRAPTPFAVVPDVMRPATYRTPPSAASARKAARLRGPAYPTRGGIKSPIFMKSPPEASPSRGRAARHSNESRELVEQTWRKVIRARLVCRLQGDRHIEANWLAADRPAVRVTETTAHRPPRLGSQR